MNSDVVYEARKKKQNKKERKHFKWRERILQQKEKSKQSPGVKTLVNVNFFFSNVFNKLCI